MIFQVERRKKFPDSGLKAAANSLFCSQRSAHKSFTELEGKDLDAKLDGELGGWGRRGAEAGGRRDSHHSFGSRRKITKPL